MKSGQARRLELPAPRGSRNDNMHTMPLFAPPKPTAETNHTSGDRRDGGVIAAGGGEGADLVDGVMRRLTLHEDLHEGHGRRAEGIRLFVRRRHLALRDTARPEPAPFQCHFGNLGAEKGGKFKSFEPFSQGSPQCSRWRSTTVPTPVPCSTQPKLSPPALCLPPSSPRSCAQRMLNLHLWTSGEGAGWAPALEHGWL